MKGKKYWTDLAFILSTLAVGGLSSIFVSRGMPAYEALAKPPLTPPSLVFPIAWSLLYLLMGYGAARVWRTGSPGRTGAIKTFGVQLALNFFWSLWFFGLQWHLFAFLWLLLLAAAILWMIRAFSPLDRTAARLQIPYLLWIAFAAYLNLGIWLLNR